MWNVHLGSGMPNMMDLPACRTGMAGPLANPGTMSFDTRLHKFCQSYTGKLFSPIKSLVSLRGTGWSQVVFFLEHNFHIPRSLQLARTFSTGSYRTMMSSRTTFPGSEWLELQWYLQDSGWNSSTSIHWRLDLWQNYWWHKWLLYTQYPK